MQFLASRLVYAIHPYKSYYIQLYIDVCSPGYIYLYIFYCILNISIPIY